MDFQIDEEMEGLVQRVAPYSAKKAQWQILKTRQMNWLRLVGLVANRDCTLLNNSWGYWLTECPKQLKFLDEEERNLMLHAVNQPFEFCLVQLFLQRYKGEDPEILNVLTKAQPLLTDFPPYPFESFKAPIQNNILEILCRHFSFNDKTNTGLFLTDNLSKEDFAVWQCFTWFSNCLQTTDILQVRTILLLFTRSFEGET